MKNIHGFLDGGASPMTARFNSMQNHYHKSKNILNMSASEVSRENIKQNTKQIQGEISGIDDEIAQLQGTLFSSFLRKEELQ